MSRNLGSWLLAFGGTFAGVSFRPAVAHQHWELPPRGPATAGLAVCVFVYCLYSSFGIAAPFWWGHHGYHGATYMLRARMSLRLHMLSPATWGGWQTTLRTDGFHDVDVALPSVREIVPPAG